MRTSQVSVPTLERASADLASAVFLCGTYCIRCNFGKSASCPLSTTPNNIYVGLGLVSFVFQSVLLSCLHESDESHCQRGFVVPEVESGLVLLFFGFGTVEGAARLALRVLPGSPIANITSLLFHSRLTVLRVLVLRCWLDEDG